MKKEESKFAPSNFFEGIISIKSVMASIDSKISDRKIETIYFDEGKRKSKNRELAFLLNCQEKYGYQVQFCSSDKINDMAVGNTHGGILAKCSERTFKNINFLNPEKNGYYVMLEGIEDPYNFGYALRSLYAAGVKGIILTPRNWYSASGVIARASAGASEQFDVYISEGEYAAEFFKKYGYTVVAADVDGENIYSTELKWPLFLIIGGEKRGISSNLLAQVDKKVAIPYGREFKMSLSTASAAAIMSFEILRQNI